MNSSAFERITYDQLQVFIDNGKQNSMSKELVEYLTLLEMVRALYDKYRTKKYIIDLLAQPPYELSRYLAQKIYADTLNFFYSSNPIKREAWANIMADKLEKLAELSIADNNLDNAFKCYSKVAELRMGKENQVEVPLELRDRRPVFYTINPADLNMPPVNRRKLAQFIDGLTDIPQDERSRLHRDALTGKSQGLVLDINPEDIEFIDEQ
jgi:hypothetical protein